MIINDFDVVGAGVSPAKTNSPLSVDTNAVLASAAALEGFQSIAWYGPQDIKTHGSVKGEEPTSGYSGKWAKPGRRFVMKEPFGISAMERLDHQKVCSAC